MKIRGSVVSLSFIFPYSPQDEKKRKKNRNFFTSIRNVQYLYVFECFNNHTHSYTSLLCQEYCCHLDSIPHLVRTEHMPWRYILILNCSLSVAFQQAAVYDGRKREEMSYEWSHTSKIPQKSILGKDPARCMCGRTR